MPDFITDDLSIFDKEVQKDILDANFGLLDLFDDDSMDGEGY